MKLETAGKIRHDSVTEEQLRSAFDNDQRRGEFIILSQQDQVFMQASGEDDGPYLLEYREGDSEHHFQAEGDLRKDDVQRAFLSYLAGDDRWRTEYAWKKLEMPSKPWWKVW